VSGTTNLLEDDQGFFVKLGGGAVDIKSNTHLIRVVSLHYNSMDLRVYARDEASVPRRTQVCGRGREGSRECPK
jgi:NH3-dependent NAD+ synthetase